MTGNRRQKAYREDAESAIDHFIFWLRSRRLFPFVGEGQIVVADLGSGYDAQFLRGLLARRKDARGIAVDLSLDPALANDRLSLVVGDLNHPLALPDASVDVAASLAVLEHLEQAELHAVEIHRILRAGGKLLLTTPSPRSKPVLEFLAFRLGVIDAGEIRDHKHYFDEKELRAILARAGFAPREIRYRPFLFGLNQFIVATKT